MAKGSTRKKNVVDAKGGGTRRPSKGLSPQVAQKERRSSANGSSSFSPKQPSTSSSEGSFDCVSGRGEHPLAELSLKPVGDARELVAKVINLDGPPKTSWRKPRGTHTKNNALSVKEKRALGVGNFPTKEQRYELFLPLHDLWVHYMKDLLSLTACRAPGNLEPKLLKADYHGCIVTVAKSRCPSYVGVTGIILQEMQNIFKLITPQNCIKSIPKAHSVFTFTLEGYHMTLYGSQLCWRASERSARKFKTRPTVDL